jgi:hypothetical protein
VGGVVAELSWLFSCSISKIERASIGLQAITARSIYPVVATQKAASDGKKSVVVKSPLSSRIKANLASPSSVRPVKTAFSEPAYSQE